MNMKHRTPKIWLALVPAVMLGCVADGVHSDSKAEQGKDPMAGKSKPTEEQMTQAPKVAEGINRFGFNLLGELMMEKKPGENMLVSPASISLNLQAVLFGSTGASRDGLMRALQFSGQTPKSLREGAYGLVYDLLKGDNRPLSIANSVWTIGDASLTPTFKETVERLYDAECRSVPDRSASSVKTINDWVKSNTRGRIDSIIDDLDPMARVFLVNAIAFDGEWVKPFDEKRTKPGDFTREDGKKVEAKFMEQSGEYRYASTPVGDAVALNYKGDEFSMILMLPLPGKPAAGLLDSLAKGNWETIVAAMPSREGSVRMPKWTFSDKYLLNEPLIAMGAGPAFSPSKDFLAMSPALSPEGYIGRVIHKTYVEVDEKGTKAAAVTGSEMRATSAPADEPFRFDANRPFVYAIVHAKTGTVLFIGLCGDPTQTTP